MSSERKTLEERAQMSDIERLRQERPAVFWALCGGEARGSASGLLTSLLG